MPMRECVIDGETLTPEEVEAVARNGAPAALSLAARARVEASRGLVDGAVREGKIAYGVNTGFGYLSEKVIGAEDLVRLQRNLIRSHSAGVGDEFPEEVVRAMILLRANTLAKGMSGVRLGTVEALLGLLNHRVCPVIFQQGSVGASGDLVPLAHIALALMGEGEARVDGKRLPGVEALRAAGMTPLTYGPKEGLALVNGTQAMSAVGVLALLGAERLARMADVAGALSLEALGGTELAFDARIHEARPFAGQIAVAGNIRNLITGSQIADRAVNTRVQDCYSLRCIPQVHGAVRDVLTYVRSVLELEINAATDNPLVFPESGEILSGGNFHGEPVAFAMDFLGIALAELANISERRIARLVNPQLSGLPPSLTQEPGVNCGYGILQIVAASLVSENKILASPASVDSIPTSANKEDHVSMGTIAARKAAGILRNSQHVLAIEFTCACQGLDFKGVEQAGHGTRAAHASVRGVLPPLGEDRASWGDLIRLREHMESGKLLAAVETVAGQIH